MDDFEKEFPGFDWRNTPAKDHPGGKNCPCPRHEYFRERLTRTQLKANDNSVIFRFCPDHYKLYFDVVVPSASFVRRTLLKFFIRIGWIKIKQLRYMESEMCFYCKFGSGGHEKRSELPPM